MMIRTLVFAGLVATVCGTAVQAAQPSSPAGRISVQERQLLNKLSPAVRQEVMSRMTGGQTVQGILETMVLNQLSALSHGGQVVDYDIYKGVATIVDASGQQRTIPFTVEQIVVVPEASTGQMREPGGTAQQPRTGSVGQQKSMDQRPSTGPSTPYPQGLGKGDQGLGATEEGNVGPRERRMGEHPAP